MVTPIVMRVSNGLTLRSPTANNIAAVLESLPRGGYVILEREGESGDNVHYAQVWLRPDGSFQLEYREGSASEHYRTRTVSREKVSAALIGWLVNEPSWREKFDWQSIEGFFGS